MNTRTLHALLAVLITISALAAHADSATPWQTGTYVYDGAGNIKSIGASEQFRYDAFGRLVSGTAGPGHTQVLTYDAFGNIRTSTTDGTQMRLGVDTTTNRLALQSVDGQPANIFGTYDDAGRLTSELAGVGNAFAYDGLDMVAAATVDGIRRVHIYTADDERIATVTVVGGAEIGSEWTFRDQANRVLRRLDRNGAQWAWQQDYIHQGTRVLAAELATSAGTRHFFADHLGSTRLTTGNGGIKTAFRTYYPFGHETTSSVQDSERLRFTSHERDTDSLDYMHARYYNPKWGRFLSRDRGSDFDPQDPQSFNLFSYVRNNPINRTDPTGLWTFSIGVSFGGSTVGWNVSTRYSIAVDDDGNVALVRSRSYGGGAIATLGQVSAEIGAEWSPVDDTVDDLNGTTLVVGGGGGVLGSASLEAGFDQGGPNSISAALGIGGGAEGHAVRQDQEVLGSMNVADIPEATTASASLLSKAIYLFLDEATTPKPPQADDDPQDQSYDAWGFVR